MEANVDELSGIAVDVALDFVYVAAVAGGAANRIVEPARAAAARAAGNLFTRHQLSDDDEPLG